MPHSRGSSRECLLLFPRSEVKLVSDLCGASHARAHFNLGMDFSPFLLPLSWHTIAMANPQAWSWYFEYWNAYYDAYAALAKAQAAASSDLSAA